MKLGISLKKRNRYSVKDTSHSDKPIQFYYCLKWTLQMQKYISSIKTYWSLPITHQLHSVCPSALCEMHLVSMSQVDLSNVLGSFSTLLMKSIYCSKQGNALKKKRQKGNLVNCYTSISNRASCYTKSVTAHSCCGLRMHKMNITNLLRGWITFGGAGMDL